MIYYATFKFTPLHYFIFCFELNTKNVDVETFDGIALLIQFHTLLCTVTSRFYGWLSLRDQVFSFSWSNKKFRSSIADDISV